MLVKDAEIGAIMSAYTRIRGTYATENRHTLTDILRTEWGFQSYVQSDFWSCRSCAASLTAGMDHEMPDSKWLNEANVTSALKDTSLEIETVDRALVRRFTQMFRFGQFERPYAPGVIDADAHGAIARSIGGQVAVLLKNDTGLLPLDSGAVGSIVLIGQSTFVDEACNGGGGSSKVTPLYTVSPLQGLRNVLGSLGSTASVSTVTVADDLANLPDALAAAASDVVVIMAGCVASEGADAPDAHLPHDQDRMIAALLAANPRCVVVLKDSRHLQRGHAPRWAGTRAGQGLTRRVRGLVCRT